MCVEDSFLQIWSHITIIDANDKIILRICIVLLSYFTLTVFVYKL